MDQLEAIARADNMMLEIDGPPRSYFEIPSADGKSVWRVKYVTLIWPITQEHFEDNLQNQVIKELTTAIKDELFKLGGGIIWWRQRPMLDCYNGTWGKVFKIRCRVATSPELSEDVWKRLNKYEEGQRIV